jgi:hypothetical protein
VSLVRDGRRRQTFINTPQPRVHQRNPHDTTMVVLDDDFPHGRLVTVLIGGLGVIFFANCYSWYRLRHIPGPFQAALSSFWLAFLSLKGHSNELWIDLDKQYGKLVRIGPDLVTTSDPKTIRQMASARSTSAKHDWYRRARLGKDVDTLFTLLHPKVHDGYKAKAAAGYSGREALSLEAHINELIQAALDLIRRKYLSSAGSIRGSDLGVEQAVFRPMDMTKLSSYFTLDVITKIAFGEEFGCLRNDEDVSGFMTELQGFLPFGSFLSYVPSWLFDAITMVLGLTTRRDETKGVGLLRR